MLSWNSRGIGGHLGSKKMQHLQNLVRSTQAQVIFISETKNSSITTNDLSNAFPIDNSFVVPAVQSSGGLWLMWTNEMDLTIVMSSQNYILAFGVHNPTGTMFNMLCIYGDPTHQTSTSIWKEVTNFVVQSNHRPTFCMGDLNDIMYDNEKLSCSPVNSSRISQFPRHIHNLGLIDLGYNGPAYTWSNKKNGCDLVLERLDRCLANVEWCMLFPHTTVYHLPMLYSDHAPIIAILNPIHHHPKKSFKFENWWISEKDFQKEAQAGWSAINSNFHSKAIHLGKHLSTWNKKKGSLHSQLKQVENQILQVQSNANRANLLHEEKRLEQLHDALMSKLSDFYKQRAKKYWIQQGDRNTSFFQQAVHKRRRKNRIAGIMTRDGWTINPDNIAFTFISYFNNLFSSNTADLTTNTNEEADHNNQLPAPTPPTEDQILALLKGMKKDASPGPDGLNVGFYIAAWPWIKQDVTEMVHQFYNTGNFQTGMNHTNITLIPKTKNPTSPADFRPISLCNVSYKIISKSLADQIKFHLPDLISETQQAFIKGRRISNNLVIAQEIVHSFGLNSYKNNSFMLKLDLSKAFDRLEWCFIAEALQRKGFHGNFINLVLSCISTASFLVNINGQSYGCFSAQRGIRQGCPLSLYLFVLAINELSESLSEDIQSNHIKGIALTPGGTIIHSLMYADDLIITGQANQVEASRIFQIIQKFCEESGQTPNWGKSSIFFSTSTPSHIKNQIINIFQFPLLITQLNILVIL